MQAVTTLLLCAAACSVVVSQMPPTVLPQTDAPPASICSLQDQIAFISTFPNAAKCGPAIATVFTPPSNDSTALEDALDNVCSNDCGGKYSNFLKSTCSDELGAETLRVYCAPTNGSAAVGDFCRYAAGDIFNTSLFDDLDVCHNSTEERPCAPGCRRALNRIKNQLGCCYQNVYNNTRYNTYLLNAGYITPSEFTGLQSLNQPSVNPWTLCDVTPPQKCNPPPFKPPAPPMCTLQDQIAFISTFPNAAKCGPAIATVFTPPSNDSTALEDALDNVCSNDCGGKYSNFLKSTCSDELGAETLRVYCAPTNGSAAVGDFCRYAAGDIFNTSLFDDLDVCYNSTEERPCAPGCKRALNRIKNQLGCCYQNVYNNTRYNTYLLNAGYITPSDFTGLQSLNQPSVNPWTLCDVTPPQKCNPPPFKPLAPPMCTLQDQIAFISTFPNAAKCGPAIATVFTPPSNDSTALEDALDNVCSNDCGGKYSNFLKSTCSDELGAETLRVYCAPTNGSAAVGNFCRYAAGDIFDTSLFDDLNVCHNSTEERPCAPGCRRALNRIKNQLGCCYQNVYNNTRYNTYLLNAGYITPSDFTGLQSLNQPSVNPWTLCDVTPPQKCNPPPFKPPASPKCTLQDQIAFISTFPNAAKCGPAIAAVFTPPSNDSTALVDALDNVCSNDCGGKYSNFLKSTCSDELGAETFRVYCAPTNGSAAVGNYCRYAAGDIFDTSLFDDLKVCYNSTEERPCAPGCRRALNRIKSQLGCCYQNVYNNTLYNTQLLLAGFITPSTFTDLHNLNTLLYNAWGVCNVTVPLRCSGRVFPVSCPRGTYRRNMSCQPCPANTNLLLSGGNATICPCLDGFFRTTYEGPSDKCSSPPSSCRNIQVRQKGDRFLTLVWARPDNTGRMDFYYEIQYSDRETTSQYNLVNKTDNVQEVIGGLTPDTTYTFTVTVHNGVSDRDERREHLRRCELITTTNEGAPSPPVDLQGFCSVVGWKMPRSPNGKLLSYDVRLKYATRSAVDDVVLLSTGKEKTFIAIDENRQRSGTLVQVRAKTSAGAGPWSDEISLGCAETSTATCPPCDCVTTTEPTQVTGVYFELGGQSYGNNSEVPLASVGEGEDNALLCTTDKVDCCGTIPNRFGDFYYPDGEKVSVKVANEGFYRNRGEQSVRLNRRENTVSPTGKFRCQIPDAAGEMQNLYITLTV